MSFPGLKVIMVPMDEVDLLLVSEATAPAAAGTVLYDAVVFLI